MCYRLWDGVSEWSFTMSHTISRSSQCSTTGVTKVVVCFILWDDAYKRTLAANLKSNPCGRSGFPLLSELSFTI